MRQPFCILSVLGDVLEDGELHLVGATQTLAAARRRIKLSQSHRRDSTLFIMGKRKNGCRLSQAKRLKADLANTLAEQSKRPAVRVVRIQLAAAARSDSHSSRSFRTTL